MRYYIDTEFNGWGGELLSMALIREDGRSLYFVLPFNDDDLDPWVMEHVFPVLKESPEPPYTPTWEEAPHLLSAFLSPDPTPIVIITDWVADAMHFTNLLNRGAMWWDQDKGCMKDLSSFNIEIARVDAYPTELENAIQHSAWWDALALKTKIEGE